MAKHEAVSRSARQSKGVASARASTAFIPSGEAMAAFKAAELSVQAAKKLAEWLQDEGPLVVQVLDASSQGGNYTVHFRAINQTVHGLYILSAALHWPTSLKNLPLGQRPEAEISFDPRRGIVEQPLPMHIPSAKAREFYLVFQLPPVQDIDAGWYFDTEMRGGVHPIIAADASVLRTSALLIGALRRTEATLNAIQPLTCPFQPYQAVECDVR